MIIITGYSHKQDGFIFVDMTSDPEVAKANLEQKTAHKIIIVQDEDGDDVECLVAPSAEEVVLEESAPRWDGWAIFVSLVDERGFAPEAVCW